MPSIQLEWKSFQVDLTKVNAHFKASLSSNYDGMICDQDDLQVMFKTDVSQPDSDAVASYWAGVSAPDFQPTLQEILTLKISDAMNFGNNMIVQASVENITLGITQAGKTKAVLDYLGNVQTYLKAGSLYAVIDELNLLLADTSDAKAALSPYVTNARLQTYKNSIQTYLGLPLT